MEAVAFLAAVVVLGVVDTKVVEFIGKLATLSSHVTRLVALVIGIGLAYAFNLDPSTHISASVGVPLRDFPDAVDWILGGVFISAAGGYLADRAGRSASNGGTKTVAVGGAVVAAGVPQHGAESHTNE